MPSLPRMWKPAGAARPLAEQKRIYRKTHDEERGSARERGYDHHWAKTRAGWFRSHPLCVACEANGRVAAGVYLDHIVPHRGDKALFWDRHNWQGLCTDCHLRVKALIEGRYWRGEISPAELRLDRPLPEFFSPDPVSAWPADKSDIWHPEWLMRSLVPVVIVCGPPASGKTTFVERHKAEGDEVIDLDDIGMRRSGVARRDWPRNMLGLAIEERNRRLWRLSQLPASPSAWLIVSEPKPALREWWQRKLDARRVVVLAASAETCKARIIQDSERLPVLATQMRVVDQWWQDYRPSAVDETVR